MTGDRSGREGTRPARAHGRAALTRFFLLPLALGLLCLVASAGVRAEADQEVDPLPIRRILLPPDKLPGELKRLRQGALVRLPRPAFETLVREARAGPARSAPRLIEARYRASLGNGQALVGTAQWKVLHPGTGPALLRLQPQGQPFNLAVKQPRYENRDAVLAEFPDPGSGKGRSSRSLALLVDKPGEHTVLLEWSARAESRPEGLQVDLRLPACPAAVLEIDLPAADSLVALDGALVSGPHLAEAKEWRSWKVACGGRTHLPLLVRRGRKGPRGAEAVLFARARTVQKLSREGLEVLAGFTLEALHQEVRELTCECDPALRPVEVTAPFLDRWEVRGNRVLIRLERPLREGVVELRCLAPLGKRGPKAPLISWRSPAVRLKGAVPRGETLEVWLHRDLRIASYDPGDYRLTDSSTVADPETKGRFRRLVFQGGAFGPPASSTPAGPSGAARGGVSEEPRGDRREHGGSERTSRSEQRDAERAARRGKQPLPRRPRFGVAAGESSFRAVQQSWWRLRPDGMSLVVQIDYEVRQGLLFELPLRLPHGWEVEAVETTPADLVRTSAVRADKAGPLLLVDLRKPLGVAARKDERGKRKEEKDGSSPVVPPFRLTVRLRPARAEPITDRDIPFPDVAPVGAPFREGGLAIDPDEQVHRAAFRTAAAAAEPTGEGPWGKLAPSVYYPYKGGAITGAVRLEPRAPRFRGRAQTDVFVASGRAAVQTRLVLEGEGGAPSQVDIYLSTPGRGWEWRSDPAAGPPGNRLRRVERLPHREAAAGLTALAASTPLEAAVLQAARPAGSFWRLTLERPLTGRRGLTLRATRTLEPAPDRPALVAAAQGRPVWDVPLALVLGGARPEGDCTLHLAGSDLVSVEGAGLRESPARRAPPEPGTGNGGAPGGLEGAVGAWRSFRYSDLTARMRLQARTLRAGGGAAEAVVDGARLSTILPAEGDLRHHFRFRLLRWSQRMVPVQLPAGARLEAAGINGHWLERLPRQTGESSDEPIELPALMSARGDRSVTYEILYTTPRPGGAFGWSRLEAEAPVLPVTPATFSRRWLLPPGLLPLWDGAARKLPGAETTPGPFLTARWPTDLFRLGPPIPFPSGQNSASRERRQALADAAAGLRNSHPGAELPLGRLVEEVAFDYLRDLHPLVLDAAALARAGLGPETAVKVNPGEARPEEALPWESLGLIALPTRSGVLLTSRVAAQPWPVALPESIEEATTRAAQRGRDPSGRFVSALEWLGSKGKKGAEPGTEQTGLFHEEDSLEGWTAWAPAGEGGVGLVVVRRGTVAGLGLALAALLALALVGLRPGGRRLRFLLGWLGLAGVALAWLPASLRDLAWWPLLAGLTLSLPWYLAWAGRPRKQASAPGSRKAAAAGAAVLTLVLLGEAAGPAQGPRGERGEERVYLLGAPSAPDKQTVLVSPLLVARLEALARPKAALTGVVAVSSSYEGRMVNGAAEFDAVFQVYALAEGPATLELPLEGVQLVGDVLLDGARVLPVALPGPGTVYALKVRGAGRHKVELRFRAAVGGGDGPQSLRQVRFGLPRLVQSRLAFRVGPGASHLQALVKHGAQRVTADAKGQRLEVDLGAVTAAVQLRWYQEGKPPRPAHVEFREAYLWDLRPDATTLTALVRYTISKGAVTSLYLDLPESLEVRLAQARRAGRGEKLPRGEEADAVRLSDWSISGASTSRVLRLDFPGPASGVVEVMLELTPRGPWAGSELLPIPRPHGQPEAKAPSYLAYRAVGLEATRTSFLRLKGIRNEEFCPFWPASSRPAASSLSYAGAFYHQQGQSPELRLQLRPQAPRVEAEQTVTLEVGARQAEATVRAQLKAPDGDLSLVEWEIRSARPFVVGNVSGPGVGRWRQSGDRLLVWLEKTTASTWVEASGWLPLAQPPAAKQPAAVVASPSLDLPCFRIAGAQARTRLILRAGPGLTLAPQTQTLQGLSPGALLEAGGSGKEKSRQSPGALHYTARQSVYGGLFKVSPGPAPVAQVRTEAGLRGGGLGGAPANSPQELTFTTTIDYHLRGELRSAVVRLRDWEGDVQLESPAGTETRRREQLRRVNGRRERTWTLDLSGVRDRYRLVLRGRMPVEEAGDGVRMPEATVAGALAKHTLLVDSTLTAEGCSGLAPAAHPPGAPPELQAWRPTGEEWSMRLLPRQGPRPAPVRVLLAEHRSSSAGGRWLHESVFWLRQEGGASSMQARELRVHWPWAVEVTSASIDASPAAILQQEPTRLWLPLSAASGGRRVSIRWRRTGAEAVDRPDLTPPSLEGAAGGPTVWTVDVPPGWEPASGSGGALSKGADRRVAVELHRAAALLAIGQQMASQRPSQAALAGVRRKFARCCRLADLALQAGADPLRRGGPGGTAVSAWLKQLREDPALLHGQPSEGADGKRDLSDDPGPGDDAREGTPLSWTSERDGKAPVVRLVPAARRQLREAVGFSGQWLVLLLGVWAVTLSGALRALLRWLWPEVMALLGVVGWQAAGPTAVVLFLLALGGVGRLMLLSRAARSLLVRPRRPPSGVSIARG
jgi:hypothetical protein